MVTRLENVELRLQEFVEGRELDLRTQLGAGYDGTVFSTSNGSAVKGFRYTELYTRERDVYLRLFEHQLFEVCGCRIQRLLDDDDQLCVIEMGIVRPPFVLDFAGAYLDQKPEYPNDIYEAWVEEKIEQYAEHWDRVQSIMATLAGYGIYLADVKPGNISLW